MMNNLSANYERIFEVLQKISKEQLLTYQRRTPKMSDLELVSLNLTAEYMGFDSETDLFRRLPSLFLLKIERSVYNRRKMKLFEHMNSIRLKLASFFNDYENYFVVDSMPLEICKYVRNLRSTICQENI